MDYGEIFVGTFRTIWRHKALWLFGILGRTLVTLGSLIYAGFALSALSAWFNMMSALMATGQVPRQFPAEMGTFFARLAGGLAILLLLWLANYVVNLIMRGATIDEAAVAWSGAPTNSRRGIRSGAGRALHIFALDLVWYIPIWLVAGAISIAGLVIWIGTISAIAGGNNQNAGVAFVLGFCGLLCCLALLALLAVVFFGTFAPLMYQSVVQGRRSLGAAISEGWRLSSHHLGPMLIFWLLFVLVWAATHVLTTIITYPFSFASMGPWMDWWSRLMSAAQGGQPPAVPSMPPINSGLLILESVVQGVIGLIVYSFTQTFWLTMYAEVYRRLAGATGRVETELPPIQPSSPGASMASATAVSEGPARVYASPREDEPSAEIHDGAARIYDASARSDDLPSDLGLTVRDEPPEEDSGHPLA